jgi:hypothetical protein
VTPIPTVLPTETTVVTEEAPETEISIPPTTLPDPTQRPILELSSNLVSGCERHDGTDPSLREGDLAVDFSLQDIHGNIYTLSERLMERPVALIYGSFT